MSCVQLICPKCYESYEIPEAILESFDKFKCNHCNFIEQKSFYSPKKIIKEEENDEALSADFTDKNIKEKSSNVQNIPIQDITFKNNTDSSSSNEVIKIIIIIATMVSLLTGFIFLLTRK